MKFVRFPRQDRNTQEFQNLGSRLNTGISGNPILLIPARYLAQSVVICLHTLDFLFMSSDSHPELSYLQLHLTLFLRYADSRILLRILLRNSGGTQLSCVQVVTEASSKVYGKAERDAYIRLQIKSQTLIPKFHTKKRKSSL